jgi:hypothetical protein
MMKTTFALVALLALTAVLGATYVYAEESVVQVPFDYHGQSCYLSSQTTYQCTWEGVIKPFDLEDLERYAHVLTEEQYAEEYAKLTAEPEPEVVVDERTPEEKLIEKLQLKLYRGEADATEATHLRLLKQLDECQRGLGNSAAIQERSSFVISNFEYGAYNNIDIKRGSQVADLLLAIQECKAQNTLEHYVLSVEYANKYNADALGFYDHYGAWEGIEALDFELYTKNSDRLDLKPICNSWLYADTHKVQMGCENVYEYEGKTNVNPKGYITYYSDANTQYQKYLQENNRYATTDDKEAQELIAQPIVKEMLEENPWHDRE